MVIRTIAAARQWVQTARAGGNIIGLIPTMGSLHEGHLSVIRRARRNCDRVIVSIFVNPLQFGAGEDYQRYPRAFDRDLALLQHEAVDAVFYPADREMYPAPPLTSVSIAEQDEILCGASRPGHFRGVATVLAKLFHIVPADCAYFGQKDAQQVIVVRTMVRDLNFPIQIEVCPTVREADGLALSSRNAYLSPDQRARAGILYRSLERARDLIQSGTRDAAIVEEEMAKMIGGVPEAEIDYARVVNPESLERVSQISSEVLVAVAVRFGKTRLIDNMIVAPGIH